MIVSQSLSINARPTRSGGFGPLKRSMIENSTSQEGGQLYYIMDNILNKHLPQINQSLEITDVFGSFQQYLS